MQSLAILGKCVCRMKAGIIMAVRIGADNAGDFALGTSYIKSLERVKPI